MRFRVPGLNALSLPVFLSVTGLAMQLAALNSNSWVVIERFEIEHCRPKKKIRLFSDPDCNMSPYNRSEIARAGLWSVCYLFPHVTPPDHTDPYCADFADDIYPVEGLALIQMLGVLSAVVSTFGLLVLECGRRLRLKGATMSIGYCFLAISGLAGTMACVCIHFFLRKEDIVYHDPSFMVAFKWWAFHAFLDGSILNITAWVVNRSAGGRQRTSLQL